MADSPIRYFYTDPLAAAWMAKHFGMRFWNTEHEIHVLPLAENRKIVNVVWQPDGELMEFIVLVSEIKIIQRAGTAFLAPEREAV
jgi:hypothetical protein